MIVWFKLCLCAFLASFFQFSACLQDPRASRTGAGEWHPTRSLTCRQQVGIFQQRHTPERVRMWSGEVSLTTQEVSSYCDLAGRGYGRGRSHSCSARRWFICYVYVVMSACTTSACLLNSPGTSGTTQMPLMTCRVKRPRLPVPLFTP